MCRFDSADLEVDYSESEHFDDYFARQFKSYDETIVAYRCGGHIPTRYNFNKAKRKLNKKNPSNDGLRFVAA